MPEETDPRRQVLAEVIKETRIARRFRSQRRLAEAAGISERSVAGAETGARVGRHTLAAIEFVFGWPNRKTTDYLNGDDDALKALPVHDPSVTSAVPGTGITIDVVPAPNSVEWLRELRDRMLDEEFFQIIDRISRRREGSGGENSNETS